MVSGLEAAWSAIESYDAVVSNDVSAIGIFTLLSRTSVRSSDLWYDERKS